MLTLLSRIAVAAALAALLFTLTACEAPNAPGTKPQPQPTEPVDPPKKSYLGTVKATVRTAGGTHMQRHRVRLF